MSSTPGTGNPITPDVADWKWQEVASAGKGLNIAPGYWKRPELTAQAFDDEGFYVIGDAVRPVDPQDFELGLLFDGRISEDFKLTSGTSEPASIDAGEVTDKGYINQRVVLERRHALVEALYTTGARDDLIDMTG